MKSKLAIKLGSTTRLPTATPRKPIWAGPIDPGPAGGVTQSMLSRFLCCRERFRVMTVEGLRPKPEFRPAIEFGQLWHIAEEAESRNADWKTALTTATAALCREYRFAQNQIEHWRSLVAAMFPRYLAYWKKHPDVRDRKSIFAERVFHAPYALDSGRTVFLRGKWDAVDLIGKGRNSGVYLQENKTKSSIDGAKIAQQLTFDLQTMFYLVALKIQAGELEGSEALRAAPIRGVRYNVVRRPAHRSVESAMKKLDEDESDNRMGEWFARWKVEIYQADIERFEKESLRPILEQLCDWWDWIRSGSGWGPLHWRHPYGVYNVMNEGGLGDIDEYLGSGSAIGLCRVDTLFSELG